MHKHLRSSLVSVAHHVPARVVTNDDLAKVMDTSDAWIRERSGIEERRYAEDGVSCSDLAVEAVRKVLEKTGLQPRDFDYMIAATLSPDYYFPGIGPLIQKKLGFPHLPALDIRVQCSAFVYGTEIADHLIRSGGFKRILLVCAEAQSRLLDPTTRGRAVTVLFGDGAGAVVFEPTEVTDLTPKSKQSSWIIDSVTGVDGAGADILLTRAPGTAIPGFLSESAFKEGLWHPTMDGKAVFKQAISRMYEAAMTLLERNKLTSQDLDLVIPHQANLRISEALREKLGLPPSKVFNNIRSYGNTTAATIPICLSEALDQGVLKKGDLCLTVAFGAGFTWGANLIRI